MAIATMINKDIYLASPPERGRETVFSLGRDRINIQFSMSNENAELFVFPSNGTVKHIDTLKSREKRKKKEVKDSIQLLKGNIDYNLSFEIPSTRYLANPIKQIRSKLNCQGELFTYTMFRLTLKLKSRSEHYSDFRSISFLNSLCEYSWRARSYINDIHEDNPFYSLNFEGLSLDQRNYGYSKRLLLTNQAELIIV
jgi:hypothetical protein